MGDLRTDPLRNFKFIVQIMHSVTPGNNGRHRRYGGHEYKLSRLGFMSVSGLQVSTEPIPYREGGMNTTTRKMPGQSDFPPVTLSRGVFDGMPHQWEWFRQIFFYQGGTGNGNIETNFRCDVNIWVLPHPTAASKENYNYEGGRDGNDGDRGPDDHRSKALFKLYNAWPVSFAFSDLDAGGNGALIEQITLVHEGLSYAIANPGGTGQEAYNRRFVNEKNL